MKTKNIFGLCLFFLLLQSSCKEEPFVPASLGSLFGQILLEDDNTPIADAEISTNPPTTTIFTDAEGRFSLENVSAGNYNLRIEKENYLTKLESVAVIPDQTTNILIKLQIDEEVNEAPAIPQLVQPAEGEIVGVNSTFIWSASDADGDELTFTLLLFENDSSNPIRTISDLKDSMYVFEDLDFGRQLYWQIVAEDGMETTFSPTQSFRTESIPDFRYHYVKTMEGKFKIVASNDGLEEICLTGLASNAWRPRLSPERDRIAFISNDGLENHIFSMNRSGSDIIKITDVPIAGYDNAELDFAWSPDGDHLIYMNNTKLYRIDKDGDNFSEIATAPLGWTFAECDWSYQGDLLLVRLVGAEPYNGLIYTMDLQGNYLTLVQSDVAGACGGGSWSIDGNYVLFTQDISGFQSPDGRQLDSHIFIKNLSSGAVIDLSEEKIPGTNDLDPRYSPDGASVIFVNTNNDGISEKNIYIVDISDLDRTLLSNGAEMPDWK